jgi:dolichol kinase
MKRIAEAKLNHFYSELPFRMPVRQDIHLARKIWHMGMGLFIAYCYLAGTTQSTAVLLLGFFLGLDLLLERMRLRNQSVNQAVMKAMGPFMRSSEVRSMSTVPHYISSTLLAIAIFPKPVAILAILYLACGDPIASLIGILYGHHGPRLPRGKSLIGTLAGVGTCALVTVIYLKALAFPNTAAWVLAAVGGLAGGLTELLPFDVDDNFTIPVVSGFILWLAFILIGI